MNDLSCVPYSVPSILRSNRFRRDARALEEDEEMWFNEDEEEEGEAVVPPVEKSKQEDDFPDSYEKFMETKKGIYAVSASQHWRCSVPEMGSIACASKAGVKDILCSEVTKTCLCKLV